MMENDLRDYFISLLTEHGSVDMADYAFKKAIAEDPGLHEEYSEWCLAVGSSEKNGFLDFCEEYLSSQDSIYDSLSDYNDD
ncbi:MAG: hypothetical protein HDS92_03625 [Bacteroidales bacterium]|nr:hypothetical protein [Bacteroidales bacterium]MBD5376982.1 hypothetical protein [Bacteroides sp.]